MDIKEISKQINDNAREKGFWEGELDIPKKLMLIISELSEAMEADRSDKFVTEEAKEVYKLYEDSRNYQNNFFQSHIKNTFEDELADAVIRIFDLAEQMKIDLAFHIEAKHKYNQCRPFKHGKKY